MNSPQRISVDGAGAASCDVCHSRLDFSWRVTFNDGSYSNRCTTHVGSDFDRAGVRRPGPIPAPAPAEAPVPEEGNEMSNTELLPDVSEELGPTSYCTHRNHKKCGYGPGGKTENGIVGTGDTFYMCPCKCHEGQAADVARQREVLTAARRFNTELQANAEAIGQALTEVTPAEVEQVPQPGSILEQENLAPVVNLRQSRKEMRQAAKAAVQAEQPATAIPKGFTSGPLAELAADLKATKSPAKKAAAKAKKDSDRPAPVRRPEQKPGEGEIKVRFGGPAVAHVATSDGTPASVRDKLKGAHVYKDGSAVIVLSKSEAKALKPVLVQADSRSARAVIKAVEEGGIK